MINNALWSLAKGRCFLEVANPKFAQTSPYFCTKSTNRDLL